MKRILWIALFLFLTLFCFANTSDGINFKVNDYHLRISWSFSDKFTAFENVASFYDILSLLYSNYEKLFNNQKYLWIDCSYSEEKGIYIVDYYNREDPDNFSNVKKLKFKNAEEILDYIKTDVLRKYFDLLTYEKELPFYMVSFPYKQLKKTGAAVLKYNKVSDLIYGDGMSLQMNDSGYAFIYIYKNDELLNFLEAEMTAEDYLNSYIINRKILTKENINENFFKTIIE